MVEPEPFVTVPKDAPADDIRWAIMRCLAARTRPMRVAAAQRVLISASEHVTDEHRRLATAVLDGADTMTRMGAV